MSFPIILLVVGIISSITSLLIGNSSKKHGDELEKVSISIHQETNSLKKRVKALEEELMIGAGPMPSSKNNKINVKPIHDIIINQILSLHAQGYAVNDIAKRSSLSQQEVISVLQSKGVIA